MIFINRIFIFAFYLITKINSMKKLHTFLAVFILFFVNQSSAQIKKGSLFLGGDVGGYTQKTTNGGATINRQNGIAFSPVVGKAIRENLIFGGELNFFFSENNNNGPNGDIRQKNFGGGVFLRKYRALGNSGFSIFVQGGLNVNKYEVEYQNIDVDFEVTKRFNIALNARPGLSYGISRKLQLEAGFSNLVSLGYFNEKRTITGSPDPEFTTNGFSTNSSLFSPSSIYVGFRLLINRKAS